MKMRIYRDNTLIPDSGNVKLTAGQTVTWSEDGKRAAFLTVTQFIEGVYRRRADNKLERLGDGLAIPRRQGMDNAGEFNPRAKLSAEDVSVIKRRLITGESLRSIASDYGCTAGNIGMISTGKTWKSVQPAPEVE